MGNFHHFYIIIMRKKKSIFKNCWFKDLVLIFSILFSVSNGIAQVSVTATAGNLGPTIYTTLNAAFIAINAGTHQGAIVISITANTTEPLATPLLKSAAPSNYTSILIKPVGGPFTINGATPLTTTVGHAIIELSGADNVTIDGDPNLTGTRNLSIGYPTAAAFAAAVIRVSSNSTTGLDGADNNTIKNCNITGNRTSVTDVTITYGINMSNNTTNMLLGGASSINNTFENNFITKCNNGIHCLGLASYPLTGLKIKNNTIGDGNSGGNVIRGILVSYTASLSTQIAALISGNDIQAGDPGSTSYLGSAVGIEANTNNYGLQIFNNNIHDIRKPAGSYAAGILISGAANMNGLSIYNNFIRDIAGARTNAVYATSSGAYGILFSATAIASSVSIDHNTIVIKPSTVVATVANNFSACVIASVAGVVLSSFRNNIIVNTDTSANAYGLYCNTTTNISSGTINNNDYYVGLGKIGYYTAAQATLGAWQFATQKDVNASNINPAFLSPTNLHINGLVASSLESGAAAGTGIITDIDGQARPGPTNTNGAGTASDVGADEFDGLPSCSGPSSLLANSITSTTAVINWTAATIAPTNGYEYYYNTSNTAPISTTTPSGAVAAGVTTASITGLTANTTYYFWVRSKCDGIDRSAWVGPSPFITTCAPVSLNVVQGFNELTIPSCWSQQYVVGSSNIIYTTSSNNPITAPQEGAGYVYWSSTTYPSLNETRLVSPPIITTGVTSVDVQFQWFQDNTAFTTAGYADEGVFVEYSTNGTTWTIVGSEITRLGGVNGWNLKTITLPAGAALQPTLYVGFRFRSKLGNNCSLDAVDIHQSPSCSPQPVSLSSSAITATTATISWAAASSLPGLGYEYFYSTSPTVPSTAVTPIGTTVGNTVFSAALTGLTTGTTYYFWVRSRCDALTTSLWAGASSFTTILPCTSSPTALLSGAILSTSATISWTAASPAPASGYDYYVSSSITAPLASATPSGTVGAGITTASLSGLSASTLYYFWVRSNCGTNNYSSWTGSSNFTTLCNSIVAPWSENFDAMTAIGNSVIPSCWKVESTTGTPWASMNAASTTYNDPSSAPNYITCYYTPYTSVEKYLITPGFNLTAGTSYDFSFLYTGDSYSGWNGEIRYNSTQTGTGSTLLGAVFLSSATTTTTTYSNVTRSFVPSTSGTYYFMVHVNNNVTPYYLGFDNFSLTLTPACAQQPASLTSSAITSNSATINWTAASPAPASGYQYYYSTSNTAPIATTTPSGSVAAGVTTANITGLTATTLYYFWVRSICNGTDKSAWVGPASFTTLCGSVSLPWAENFDAMTTIGTSVIPSCWKVESASGTPWASMNAASISYNDPASSPNYITCNYSPTASNKFLITPGFSLVAGSSYNFSFQYVGDGYSGWTADLGYNTTQTGAGYTVLGTAFLNSTTISSTSYSTITQNFIPATTGVYYFVIRVNSSITPWYLGFDNFSMNSLSACTGTPVGGIAAATPALGVVSSVFNLNATGYSTATGLTYQWQSSANATGPWANITGATTVSYNVTASSILNTTTYYHLLVTCTATGLNAQSSATSFTTNYCTAVFSVGCVGSNDYVNDFILNTLSNVSSGCNGNPNNYIFYPATGTNTTTLTQGVAYNASVNIGRGGSGNVAIWIDYNNNGVFETTERYVNTILVPVSGTVIIPISIPAGAIVGNHRLRVVEVYNTALAVLDPCAAYTYGETEDYTISIVASAICAGLPVPGNTIANITSVCTGSSVNLSLQNQITGSGVTYQWQSASLSTGTWTNIGVATSSAYSPVVSTTIWYRCAVTCSAAGTSYSTAIQIISADCIIMPSSGSTTATTCSANFYDSGGSLGNYNNNESGVLTIYPLTVGSFVKVTFSNFDLETCCDNLKIYNGNSVAAPLLGTYTTNPNSITSTAADGSLTFVFTSDFSLAYTGWEAVITCYTPPPCTGVPIPGITLTTNSFVCVGSTAVLSVANPPAGTGVTYQWQSALDVAGVAGTYINIATSATSPNYNYTPAAAVTLWYRCTVTCSGNAVNSIGIQIISAACTNVNMTTGSSSTCSARFFDSGGSGGSDITTGALGNYSNNESLTYTFYPATAGAKIKVAFNSFTLESGGFDYLKIYDGNSAASLLLGSFITNPGTITSTASDGSLTFVFTSDGSVNKSGWDASVTCFIPPPCTGVPFGGTAATSPSTGPAGSTFTLNATGLTAATGLSFQWQSSPDAIAWTDIPGATTIPSTIPAPGVAGVVSTMYYQLIVICTNSGISGTSSTTSFITASYCTPSHTTASTYYINKISFLGTLNDVNNNSSYVTSGYQDFTGLPSRSVQAQGEGINLYVQSNLSSAIKSWVDWNNDGNFDVLTEQVYTSGSTYTSTTTFGFVIPLATAPRNYRIRIRATRGGGTAFGPCELLPDGETEDYLFTVVPTCTINITSVTGGQVCGSGPVALSVTATAGATQYFWYAIATGGIPVATTTTPNWTTPTIVRNTTYYVTAGNGSCESIVRTPIKANLATIPVLTFTPNNPIVCGEGAVLRLNATGDVEEGILINENFENGLGLFSVVNIIDNGAVVNGQSQWQQQTSTFVPTYTAVWHPAISSGVGVNKFLFATSDLTYTEVNTSLVSAAVNTTGFLDLYLDFSVYYSHYLPDGIVSVKDSVLIDASIDGGLTWTNAEYYIDDQGIGTRFIDNSVNISSYINYPNVKFRFRYHGDWADGIAIDDIKLYGYKPLSTIFSWSPVNQNNLFTDSTGLIPYTGGSIQNIFIKPTLAQLDAATSLTFTATATLSNGCAASSPVVISITPSQWTGSSGTNWHDINNWCSKAVPLSTTKVEIPTGVLNYPVIDSAAFAASIKIFPAASITLSNLGSLSVKGTFDNNGTLTNNGRIELNGNILQTFPGAGIVNAMNTFHINNTGPGVSLNKSLSITKELRPTNGILALGNYDINIKSTPAGTAYVSALGLTSGFTYGTGRFIVERYIPTGTGTGQHGKSWQLLSAPLKTSQTVKQAWQDSATIPNQNRYPGYGTQITGQMAAALSLGFDVYTPVGPTMKTFDAPTATFIGIPSTNAYTIQNKKGFMVFVRGNRNDTAYNQASEPTTLRAKGILFTTGVDAPPTTSVLPGKFESIGNPYASPIEFTNLIYDGPPGIDNAFYVWDPLLGGLYGYGGYQTISPVNGDYYPSPGGTTNYPTTVRCTNIQSGQAFLMHGGTIGGTVTFTETAKSVVSRNVTRPTNNTNSSLSNQYLKTHLYAIVNGQPILADGNVVSMNNTYSNSYSSEDALKFFNGGENFGLRCNDKILAIEARKELTENDTIFYASYNLRSVNYKLEIVPENMNGIMLVPYLIDRYLQTSTQLSLTDTSIINFTVVPNTASALSDRFIIVFHQLQPVPVRITNIAAKRNSDNSISVDWKVQNEMNIGKYQLERSAEGRFFNAISFISPSNNNGGSANYNYIDQTALLSDNFYRIKAVDIDRQFCYSSIVKVGGIKNTSITVNPNPITDNKIQVFFNNASKGDYNIKLRNAIGQLICETNCFVSSENQRKSIFLNNKLASGIYKLIITQGKGQSIVIQIIVD